ncbi:hypothetical protein ACS0TY_024870 [Phlomoides rotata]
MLISLPKTLTSTDVGYSTFFRSGQTVSKYFNVVLSTVLKLHSFFLVEPSTIINEWTDPRWKCFKGCLGALDGTYIDVKVLKVDKSSA